MRKDRLVEALEKLYGGHGLIVCRQVTPLSQQADNALPLNTLGFPCGDACVAVPFGESVTIVAENEWEMGVRGLGFKIECVDDEDLSGGGGNQIITTDNFSHVLPSIINDDGELVRRLTAFGPDDEVPHGFRWIVSLSTRETVGELDGLIRHNEAPVCVFIVECVGAFDRSEVSGEMRIVL